MSIDKIHLNRAALDTIMLTALESTPREPKGFLFGNINRVKNEYICTNAYPVLNTNRKPTEVSYTNIAAVSRVQQFFKLMKDCKERNYQFIGGYHVHPFTPRDNLLTLSHLSDGDRSENCIIWDDAIKIGQQEWVEVIVRTRRISSPLDTQYRITPLKKRVRINLGYDKGFYDELMFSAFLLSKDEKAKNGKLKSVELKIQPNGY